jgi:biotin transport system permease protein
MLTSLHVEGRGPLHRLRAGTKLAGLALSGIILFLIQSPAILLACLAVAALAYFTIGLSPRAALSRIAPTLWSLVFLMAVNLFLMPVEAVAVLALRILALILAAAAVTASTPLTEMMGAVDRLLRPFERFGWLRRGDAGLTLGLVMRFVPEVHARYRALAEAHKARGLKIRFLTVLGPLIILTLKQADDVAAAIDARGLRAPPSVERPNRS